MLRLLALLLALPLAAPAQPWMDAFDPSACPGGAGDTVAVRLVSGYAFRMPAEAFSVRDPLPPPDDPALPAYGCPENPIVARAVTTVLGHMQFLPEGFTPHRPMRRPVSLTLYGHDGPMGTFKQWVRWVEEGPSRASMSCLPVEGGIMDLCTACAKASVVEKLYCRLSEPNDLRALEDLGFWARARPGTHPEGEGLPLAAYCSSNREDDPTRNFARDCSARYALGPDLLVVYGYDGNVVTLPMLPAFDLALRDWIDSRRASDLDSQARNIAEGR